MFKKIALASFFLINLLTVLLISTRPKFVDASIHTPTATPINYQELNILQELISDSECVLPCWLGWKLGEDNWVSIQTRASAYFGETFSEYQDDDYQIAGRRFSIAPSLGIPDTDEYTTASLRLMVNDQDSLTAIFLHLWLPFESYLDWTPLMPSGILSTYGLPDEITVVYPTDPIRTSYILNMRYFDQNLYIRYRISSYSTENSSGLYICNKISAVSEAHIWIQSEEITLPPLLKEELVWEVVRSRNASNLIEWDIENITTFETLEDFIEVFSQEDTCFYSLPLDEWVRSE